jgi:hypothetical protein
LQMMTVISMRSIEGIVERRARSDIRSERDRRHRAGAECTEERIVGE